MYHGKLVYSCSSFSGFRLGQLLSLPLENLQVIKLSVNYPLPPNACLEQSLEQRLTLAMGQCTGKPFMFVCMPVPNGVPYASGII